MQSDNFLALSGFRDNTNSAKDFVVSTLTESFKLFGFNFLETPSLERQEILLGKFGDEAQKLLYLFEDNGGRKVGLRYDLTVPLSRFIAANLNTLTFPFKRYEIGNVWRAERPQKGRYRQFTQADVDIIGSGISAEKELLELIKIIQQKLNIEIVVQLNDRQLVKQVFSELLIEEEQKTKLLQLLDKKEKISQEQLNEGLLDIGLSDVQRSQLQDLFIRECDIADFEQVVGNESVKNIKELLDFVKSINLNAQFVPSMVRGLDYYTGTIIECVSVKEEFKGLGSIVGGGRYDNLIESLTGQKLEGIGISFGVDRLMEMVEEQKNNEDMFLVNLKETENETALWASKLRNNGIAVNKYLDSTVELGKQIKYADKLGYKKIYIPFESEWKAGEVVVKYLDTGNQETISRSNVAE